MAVPGDVLATTAPDRLHLALTTFLRRRHELMARAARVAVGPGERSWLPLSDDEDLNAWLIVWGPGSRVRAHDHGASHALVHVVRGALVDVRMRDEVHGPGQFTRVGRNESVSVAAGAVHGIANEGRRRALSLHLYSPRLVAMTFHDQVDEAG